MIGQDLLILGPGEVHLWRGAFVERQKREKLFRQIIVSYGGKCFDKACLNYLPAGKPVFKEGTLHFSLSHTENKLFAAFANFAVGMDVEASDRKVALEAIARRYFHPSECAFLETCSEVERQRAFFRMWVRKEAAVKMTGEGLSHGLRKIVVDPLKKEGWSLHREGEPLFVKEIIRWPGVLGAIVARCQFSITAYREF